MNSNRKEIWSKLMMKRNSTLLLKSATGEKVKYKTRKTVFDHIYKRVKKRKSGRVGGFRASS